MSEIFTEENMTEEIRNTFVLFKGYYKYEFTFSGITASGKKVILDVGGNSDDIYRFEVDTEPVTVGKLLSDVNLICGTISL